jgi:hypothetical protein
MSTWLDDLRKTNPRLASAYSIVGNQSRFALRNMVRALTIMPMLNTDEDNRRLEAAQYILSNTKGVA